MTFALLTSSSSQTALWNVVGLVFIAEYVLPPIGKGLKACFVWVRDLRDLRNDLYEEDGDEVEGEEGEEDE